MWTKTIIFRCPRGCIPAGKRTMTSAQSLSRALLPNLQYGDDLFNYTRGCFVRNEHDELSQRHIRFNVNELARCAAEAIGADLCVEIKKYPDGMYNKSMLLTMSDGTQVVAKVPNPNAGQRHFTTASEVATMDFARNVLGTPVPKVLAWNSRAGGSPVGAEYIIMEKVQGIELEQAWPNMAIEDRLAVVKTLVSYQKAWTSILFKKFGSLYYSKDLDKPSEAQPLYTGANGIDTTNATFSVGPSVGRESFDDGRATVGFDRGPWSSLEAYHAAIGNREMACVNQVAQLPKSPITLCGPGTYLPTREKKIKALNAYLKLIEFLLPTDPESASAHLWHSDLHVANIFVNPSKPTQIVGLIDWQATELAPLYFQARQPQIIDYDGPPVQGLERPQPPQDLEKLDAAEKKRLLTIYEQQSLCVLYNILTHHQNPKLYTAHQFQHTMSHTLLLLARNLLIDGEATYLLQVAELEATWNELPGAKGSAYPFSFSKEERGQIEAEVEGVVRGMDAMHSIRESIGKLFPEQGIVRPELYEEALDALSQMKEQVIDTFATTEHERHVWEKMWPFGP